VGCQVHLSITQRWTKLGGGVNLVTVQQQLLNMLVTSSGRCVMRGPYGPDADVGNTHRCCERL
jgi:hypothetical protein